MPGIDNRIPRSECRWVSKKCPGWAQHVSKPPDPPKVEHFPQDGLNPDASRSFAERDNGVPGQHDKNARDGCVDSVVVLAFDCAAAPFLRNRHDSSAALCRSDYTDELGSGIPRTKRIGRLVPTRLSIQ